MCGPGQRDWVLRMTAERANVGRAVASAFALDDHAAVVELSWDLVVFLLSATLSTSPTRGCDG